MPYSGTISFNKPFFSVTNPYTYQMGVSADELKRVNNELAFWKFYRGEHWTYIRQKGEPQNTFNYCSRFVDKSVSFLMGKGFTINVETGAEDIVKKYLDWVWEDNQKELLGIEMAQTGSVTGNAWVKVVYQEYNKETEPLLYELYPQGRIRLLVLPGHACFPIWDNHDKDKMLKMRIIYPIEVPKPNVKDEFEIAWFREEITPTQIIQYINDEIIESKSNDVGEIPVIRIKNIPFANESFGKSDLIDIIPINKEFNEKTTDISDIINYHSAPVTLMFGARSTNLEKGARKIWGGLPKDSRVENLELKSDLSATMKYIDLLKKSLFEIGNMPEDAFGSGTNISNTSGVALHIKNQPLMDLTNIKRRTYGEGIEKINRLILRYLYLYELDGFSKTEFDSLTARQKWVHSIEFGSPLPKDELIQMQLIVQKLTHNLTTRLDALKELGVSDANTKLEEIKDEFLEWADLMIDAKEVPTISESNNINIGGIVPKEEQAKNNNTDDIRDIQDNSNG